MADTIELRQYLKFYLKIQKLIDEECQHCSNRDNEPCFLNKNLILKNFPQQINKYFKIQ
jgi:hypothetical protein